MLDDRFWTKVDREHPSGCWLWLAHKNNKGYGLFRPGGIAPNELAHRLAYEATHGPIPKGGLVLHSCDTRSCCNPAHLRVGTHRDNVSDMDMRGRRVVNPRRGETNPNTSATDAAVTALRIRYVAGDSFDDLVANSGLSLASVKEYCIGHSFAHLYGTPGHPTIAEMKAEAGRRRRNGAKINQAVADQIRSRLANGETGRALAREFGIHFATVSDIKLRKIWP